MGAASLSVIQLQRHWFTEFGLKPNTSIEASKVESYAVSCEQELDASYKKGDSCSWLLRMRLRLVPSDDGSCHLYTGQFEVVGRFELDETCPEEDRPKIAVINGGSLLYASIREWVATLSSRSLHGMIELPAVDPRSFLKLVTDDTLARPAAKRTARKAVRSKT